LEINKPKPVPPISDFETNSVNSVGNMFDKMCYNTCFTVALEFLKLTTSFVSCNFISEAVK